MKAKQAEAKGLESYDVNHLGIVAGIVDDIGLVETINEKLGRHVLENISFGQVVKAMIVNGLGFVSAPMYLYGEFFRGKNLEELIGAGVKAEDLNDDKLGKTLDRLYEGDLTKTFITIALKAAKQYGVNMEKVHLDSSSMHVHGKYERGEGEKGKEGKKEEEEEFKGIEIKHGYSRDKRPDLKQFMLDLMVSEDGEVPIFYRAGSGNEHDSEVFGKLIKEYQAEVNMDTLFVSDAALYSEGNLKMLREMKWLSRVPMSIKEAKTAIEKVGEEELREVREGYRVGEIGSEYGGVKQRWVVVESEQRKEAALKKLVKEIEKEEKEGQKELKKLGRKRFGCEADARESLKEVNKNLKYHQAKEVEVVEKKKYVEPGRPNKDSPYQREYQVNARLEEKQEAIEVEEKQKGRFVLATNELEVKKLSSEEVLNTYKEQQTVERGFKFLKDPLFFTSSVFLKTPKRIAALGMIMGLCLLVYSLGQRFLRKSLEEQEETIRHQSGKRTNRPTLRWVFQMFQAVHLLVLDGQKLISNLTDELYFKRLRIGHFQKAETWD